MRRREFLRSLAGAAVAGGPLGGFRPSTAVGPVPRRGRDAFLVPMDAEQPQPLRAYGVVYRALRDGGSAEWLLNHRGGSFLVDHPPGLDEALAHQEHDLAGAHSLGGASTRAVLAMRAVLHDLVRARPREARDAPLHEAIEALPVELVRDQEREHDRVGITARRHGRSAGIRRARHLGHRAVPRGSRGTHETTRRADQRVPLGGLRRPW